MTKRNPFAVFLLSFISIYQLYWLYNTKEEMNELGTRIPTLWLTFIPFYWDWKYSVGVEEITYGSYSKGSVFFLLSLKLDSGMLCRHHLVRH